MTFEDSDESGDDYIHYKSSNNVIMWVCPLVEREFHAHLGHKVRQLQEQNDYAIPKGKGSCTSATQQNYSSENTESDETSSQPEVKIRKRDSVPSYTREQ